MFYIDYDDGRNISKLWYDNTCFADDYKKGKTKFDSENFRFVVEKTYLFFKRVKESLKVPGDANDVEKIKEDYEYMLETLSYIEEYVREQSKTKDRSKDKIFTASCLVAIALTAFAKQETDEYYKDGKEPLLYFHPEWWTNDTMDIPDEADRVYSYDYTDGDMSDMLILAKYIN